ncbi:MAG: TonB-dependent receptor plug domain-containing protein [Rhodospirillaceae bacterium]
MAAAKFPGARTVAPAALLMTAVCGGAQAMEASAAGDLPDLMRLSIEELAEMEISSVSRRAERVSAAPAAVYVITSDRIRLSGTRTIPETLRLAPNLIVGRTNAIAYAISARGFNTPEASNKLLALMDGRSLYSPLHSGVFWEDQDYLLDDIERIEVISGPGGTLWGANAVNGVINIITKSTRDTQGVFVKLGAGNIDKSGAARYGGRFGEKLTYRAYVKAHQTGDALTSAGVSADDSMTRMQGGFRSDFVSDVDTITVQGDLFNATSDDAYAKLRGGNVLFTWTRTFEESQLRFKTYYDRTTRIAPATTDRVKSFDAELQHNFRLADAHDVVWGAGYRRNTEDFVNAPPFVFAVPKRTLEHANIYVQDTYAVTPTLRLIGGIKFEHNEMTGWEIMPSGRIAWQAAEHTFLWAAVSRAVRTPNRIDRELEAMPLLIPATNFSSEEMLGYEVGYRGQINPDVTLSISGYYNIYNDVRTTGASVGGGLPLSLQNGRSGRVYGVEAWATYHISDAWRLDAGVNALAKKTRIAIGQVDLIPNQHLGNDPEVQGQVRATYFVAPDLDLSIGLRAVDDLPSPVVPGYTELDARVAWRLLPNVELSVVGKNLLHKSHPEVGDVATRREIPRSVFGMVYWAF